MQKVIPRYAADLSLLAIAAVWGLTFVSLKNALAEIAPFSFNVYRFSIAALLLLLIAPRCLARINKETFFAGLLLGLFLFGGHSLQTVGLLYTTASNAGFLTGLVVVFVPLLLAVITKQPPPLNAWVGAASAFAGVAVLSLSAGFHINTGDFLVMQCSVCFALQVIYLGRYCHRYHILQLVFMQIITVAVFSLPPAIVLESLVSPAAFTPNIILALFITAVLATTLAFFVQGTMQKYTTPTRTAIVLSAEPVFAALFAALLLGETIGGRVFIGGALVLFGMIFAESGVLTAPCSQKLSAKRGEFVDTL